MNKQTESKALREVRQWKAACAHDVSGLKPATALRRRLRDSAKNARELGFVPLYNRAEKGAD